MTVPNDENIKQYPGNGTEDTFAFTWKIFDEEHLQVIVTDADGVDHTKVLNSDFTVEGVGEESGGNVVFVEAAIPDTGEMVTITGAVPYTQPDDFSNTGSLDLEAWEASLDKQCRQILQLLTLINQAILLPASYDGDQLSLPALIADRYLKVTSGGDGVEWAAASDMDGYTITALAELLLAKSTAAEMRALLEVAGTALGQREGLGYEYASASTITINGGSIEINGEMYRVTSALTPTLTGLGVVEKHFLFFEAPGSGSTLTTGEFSNSTTPPTKDHAKGGGRYDSTGLKRCIGWIPTDDEGAIRNCRRVAQRLFFIDPYYLLTTTAPATSFASYGLGAGAAGLSERLPCLLQGHVQKSGTANVDLLVRDGGGALTGAAATLLAGQQVDNLGDRGEGEFMTDTSEQFEYMATSGSTIDLYLKWVGIPEGM